MKAIVYNINQEDKELLALANRKKHTITIIAYPLDEVTIDFAVTKDVVIIINQEKTLSPGLIQKIIFLGIRNIIFRSQEQFTFDSSTINDFGLKYVDIKTIDPKLAASEIIEVLDSFVKSD